MVRWTDNSISNITDFIDSSKEGTENTAKAYMNKLIDYVDILNTMPELGKVVENNIFKYEIRQIVYKSHKVIYHKKDNDIIILTVLHSKMDYNAALKRLKNIIK